MSSGVPVAAAQAGVAGALFRAGALPAAVISAAVIAAASPWGLPAVTGAGIGSAAATGALAVGPLLLRLGRDLDPPLLFGLALGGYAAVVMILGGLLVLAGPATWLSGKSAGVAAVAVTSGWLAGQLRATRRLRILAFGSLPPGGEKTDTLAGHLPKSR